MNSNSESLFGYPIPPHLWPGSCTEPGTTVLYGVFTVGAERSGHSNQYWQFTILSMYYEYP